MQQQRMFLAAGEESAEGEGHGLSHVYGHPAAAVWLRGNLQRLQAAAADAHEGLPAERRGGHYRRYLGPGARMRQSLLHGGCQAGALRPKPGGPGRAHQRTCFSGHQGFWKSMRSVGVNSSLKPLVVKIMQLASIPRLSDPPPEHNPKHCPGSCKDSDGLQSSKIVASESFCQYNVQVQTHKPYMVTFDLADPGAIVTATAEILQCFGHVDVLINNAGISYRGAIVDTTTDVDKKVMETNYFGPVALTKALLPSMIKRRQGHIVAISSIQGKISIPFRSAYAASKHATQAFFDCLRAEMEQYEIEVTVVSPGYIHTNLSLNAVTADGSTYGVMDKTTAQGRSPAEVARDVLAAVGKKKKDVILADLLPSLAIYLRTLAPGLFFRLMASRARKERKSKNS
ncbi:dehydrogenase/reductase SDR family member 7B isoform X3 [Ursus arctos]|uniref:dehydrogenase/reductase SDR family member 7B isoform X3 n=1 Tax=Ursus arctos TaxID=9644 RepID=UPI001CF8FE70|nr:dehydrogenase/reductase SDR family member 7B isoform X3 [Ursus arctos]